MRTAAGAESAREAAGSAMAKRFIDVSSLISNCVGAGAATAAPPPEDADPAEPAAKVGAVDGALKPPSDEDDAMVCEFGRKRTHQAGTSRATADNLRKREGLLCPGIPRGGPSGPES